MASPRQQLEPHLGIGRRTPPRYRVAAPMDIVILRSGVPETIPARTIDLGEGGIGAIAAGELQAGQSVGIELFLPEVSRPVRARALVRHQQYLRCGLQFLSLSPQEQEVLRYWINHAGAMPVAATNAAAVVEAPPSPPPRHRRYLSPQVRAPRPRRRTATWLLRIAALTLVATAFAWWRWQDGWKELEYQASAAEARVDAQRVRVPAPVMAQRIVHRLDPMFPQSAREAGIQGVVILGILIGTDGTVKSLHTLSGPPELAQAALDAVRWWKFQPLVLEGQPVEADTTVAIEFRP